MKSVILKKLAKQKAKQTAKNITKQQGKKILETKKKLNDELKDAGNTGREKYNILNRKLSATNNISEANKIIKDMKDFIADVKSKPSVKKVKKGQFATMEEARQAAKDAGKKTFNFGGKTRIPVTRVREKKGKLAEMTKDMSKEEKAKFKNVRGNELRKLKTAQLKEMMADKYGGGTSLGGVRVQKLTPEGEKLLKENKLSTIVNAQKFIKFRTKDGKTKVVPSNKYIVEGIGSRDAPLVPKGAMPKTREDKKAFREYFENEMDDSQRLEYILQRYEPQFTSSQLADKLGITARDLNATIKGSSKTNIDESEVPKALREKFQVRSISKDMKTGGIVKAKKGTGKRTIGKVRDYIKKNPLKSAMGGLGAYEVYDVGKYALDTLGPIVGLKSGTKGKTIRGCGKALRGYGKAMSKKGMK